MLSKPSQGFRSHPVHRDIWEHLRKLTFKSTNPTVGQHDISVQDLSRQRVDSTWPNRSTNIVVQPANEVVTNVFRIFVHVAVFGFAVLLHNLDCIFNSDIFERFVPRQNPFANPAAIANWSCVFDIKANLLLRRAQT